MVEVMFFVDIIIRKIYQKKNVISIIQTESENQETRILPLILA